jgi:hypothetical protein
MPTRRPNLRITMLQPTSVNSVALPLLLVFGQKLGRFLARKCLPFGPVVSHSPISQPRVPKGSSVWSRSHLMEALSLQAAISLTWRLSMAQHRHLILLRKVPLELQATPRALRRARLGSPPPAFPLRLTWLLANVSKTISAASLHLRPTITQQLLGRY